MPRPAITPRIVRFGVFEIDVAKAELRKNGLRIRIQEQPYKILLALLERPGEVVTRDELVRRLWPDGTFVDYDRSLNAAMTRLRQTLADTAENPRYIARVARHGYRFLMSVEPLAGPDRVMEPEAPVGTPAAPATRAPVEPMRGPRSRAPLAYAGLFVLQALMGRPARVTRGSGAR